MSILLAFIGLIIYFLILLFVVIKNKNIKNSYDYFFADRSLPFWALSITFVASWWGAGSALSSADLAFGSGMGAFFYYGVPVLISTFLMILGAAKIRRVGYLTQGKMMEKRYSKLTARILSVMIVIFMIFNAASQMVGIGDFFGTYLGINYELAIILGTSIVLIYSMFGGFKAVVITDIIQFVLLSGSVFLVFIYGLKYSGGIKNIAYVAESMGKTGYMDIFSGTKKYMVYVITFGCSWVIQANVWQRISAARNDKDARNMAILSFVVYIPLYLMVVITGMAGFAIYKTLPQGGIIIAIVRDYMSPLVATIVFVGISAAIMSTMDSLINTGAMTLLMDFDIFKKDSGVNYSRIATLIITMVAFLIAIRIRSILKISWIASDVITTGVFIPLVFGFVWKRGNSYGAISSMIMGLVYCLYNLFIEFGINLPHFWKHNSTEQVILGVLISTFLYFGVSLLTQPEYLKAEKFIKKGSIKRV